MAAYINHGAHDAFLSFIKDNATHLHIITTAQPTTWAEATGVNRVGTKAAPTFTGPSAGDVNGRKLVIDAISDGTVSGSGTAAFFAITNDTTNTLLYTNALGNTQVVTDGNVFGLTSMKIELPDPA
jgi:hypothetical protein